MKTTASAVFAAMLAWSVSAPRTMAQVDVPDVPILLFAGEPRGPHRTGTLEIAWVDERGEEPRSQDQDQPRLRGQVWYPAAESSLPVAPYVLNPDRFLQRSRLPDHGSDIDASRWTDWRGQMQWPEAVRYVRTNSMVDAPVAGADERYPVLIYSHGAGQAQFTATFHAEFLASHGYVVVAIGHPGYNGEPHRRSEASPELSEDQRKQLSVREQAEWRWRHGSLASPGVSRGVANISFVLDQLELADATPGQRFHRRLDLQRVGALGYSWGGSISVQAGVDEPRVKAVVNEDGGPWGLLGETGAVIKGSPRPVMIMSNSSDWPFRPRDEGPVRASLQGLQNAMASHYWAMLTRTSQDWYWLRLARSEHRDFSDRPLFDHGQGARDPEHIHPRLAHSIINHYALEFFDKYLRGRTDTPLLSGAKRYHEASLVRDEADE